jgi:peptidoglycan hydrolase-like protein with peptidoglycan-binding domain
LRALGWTARDAIGVVAAACVGLAILINLLFMQSGLHPAPIFGVSASRGQGAAAGERVPIPPPRRMNAEPTRINAAAGPRTPGEIITDIQRELLRRGYYEGPIDGLYGPRTDGAIREFGQAAGFQVSFEPTEILLQAIRRAPPKLPNVTTSPPTGSSAIEAGQQRLAPSSRVIALQRALSAFGYGQIKTTGIVDVDTQHAIEKFERDRNLPVTRQFSERLARELSAMTGRMLE